MPSNLEIFREAEARTREDPTAFLDYCDPEIVWDPGETMPEGRVYRGHDGVREFWVRWVSTWADYEWENRQPVELGDQLVFEAHSRGRGRGSGAMVEWSFGQIYSFRDGKITRQEGFATYDEALAEARRRAGQA